MWRAGRSAGADAAGGRSSRCRGVGGRTSGAAATAGGRLVVDGSRSCLLTFGGVMETRLGGCGCGCGCFTGSHSRAG